MSYILLIKGYPEAAHKQHESFGKLHDVVKAATTWLFAGPPVPVSDTAWLKELATQLFGCSVTLGHFTHHDQLNGLLCV